MANITVVLTCNEQYAMPLATALRSVVEANRGGHCLDFYVLTSDFSAPTKQRVADSLPAGSASVHWVTVDIGAFKDFVPPHTYQSMMTYARLLMPQVFSESVDRVIYLDADVVVLGDLGPLWDTDLEGSPYGAVIDSDWKGNAERIGLSANLQGRKSDPGEYFNAGVLIVDLARWRQDRISEKALEFLERHPRTLLADQDALNATSNGMWKKLDSRWNCQHHPATGYSKLRVEERPSIIHFAGKWKPWNPANPSVDACFYDGFRARTRFARTTRENAQDAATQNWALFKRFLKQYKFICQVRDYFVRQLSLGGAN